MTRLQLLIFAVLATASASAGCVDAPSEVPAEAQLAVVDDLGFRMFFPMRERLVIRDTSTWATTWAAAGLNKIPPPPVDFARHAIVIAAMGPAGSSRSIRIDGVYLLDGNMWIQVTERIPMAGCPELLDLRYPLVALLTPAITGKATFVERLEQTSC